MTPAVSSLIALAIAIILSCTSKINVGTLAIAFAWIIGVYQAGWKPDAVAAGFPVTLFITLAGVTMLFAIAETNGTLERLTHRVARIGGGGAASCRSSSSCSPARSPRWGREPCRPLRS